LLIGGDVNEKEINSIQDLILALGSDYLEYKGSV